jgi:hypothetical protein
MATAEMERVGARVAFLIGARGDAYAFLCEDDRFDRREIGQAIDETEAEIVTICAEGYHPQDRRFREWVPESGMINGEIVQEHVGQIRGVRVTAFDVEPAPPIDEDDWMLADVASLTQIRLWREDVANRPLEARVFENTEGYYSLINETLEFTGGLAQVLIVNYEPDYADTADPSESEAEEGTVVVVRTIPLATISAGSVVQADAGTGNFSIADIGRFARLAPGGALIGQITEVTSVDEAATDGGFVGEPQVDVDVEIYEIVNTSAGTLQISDLWEPCLIAGAISRLAKVGVPAALVGHYTNEYEKCKARIRQGMMNKPEIDEKQRTAA